MEDFIKITWAFIALFVLIPMVQITLLASTELYISGNPLWALLVIATATLFLEGRPAIWALIQFIKNLGKN